MDSFTWQNPVKLFFGLGNAAKVGELSKSLGTKALVVTGRKSAKQSGLLATIHSSLLAQGIQAIAFDKVVPNPVSDTVDEGVALAREQGCNFVIGAGGGSAIDTAKAIALCALNEGKIVDYQPGGSLAHTSPQQALPVVAMPTTAGTGSETNRFFVITNSATKEKPRLGFSCTYPAIAIVDPQMTVSLPMDVTADTGIDVLFHSLEAYVSRNAQPFSDIITLQAIKLVVGYLERVLKDAEDIDARCNMAWASALAGWATDIAGTVAIHAAAHPISGHMNVSHGRSLAALGSVYMAQNYHANPRKFAILARTLGVYQDHSDLKMAAESPNALQNFLRRVGRDSTAAELGIAKEMVPKLAADTFKTMQRELNNNPRPLEIKDIEDLYLAAL